MKKAGLHSFQRIPLQVSESSPRVSILSSCNPARPTSKPRDHFFHLKAMRMMALLDSFSTPLPLVGMTLSVSQAHFEDSSMNTHNQRPELANVTNSNVERRTRTFSSTQMFIVSLVLLLVSLLERHYYPQSSSPVPRYHGGAEYMVYTKGMLYTIDRFLSPLMIMSLTMAGIGTLCRGAEQVVQHVAFKAR